MGDADRVQVLHRAHYIAARERRVAGDRDLADFDLGAFHHGENHFERGWRNAAQLRSHHCELVPVLGQQFLEHDGRVVDHIRVVHRFHRQADLAFLEPVQDIGGRNRFRALVLDVANYGPLGHDECDHDSAAVALLGLEPDVVEAVGVPQRHEIAPQRVFVIGIADLAENHRPQVSCGTRRAPRNWIDSMVFEPTAGPLFSSGAFGASNWGCAGGCAGFCWGVAGGVGSACGMASNGLFWFGAGAGAGVAAARRAPALAQVLRSTDR